MLVASLSLIRLLFDVVRSNAFQKKSIQDFDRLALPTL